MKRQLKREWAESKILSEFEKKPIVYMSHLCDVTRMSTPTIQLILDSLLDEGVIKQSKSKFYYKPKVKSNVQKSQAQKTRQKSFLKI